MTIRLKYNISNQKVVLVIPKHTEYELFLYQNKTFKKKLMLDNKSLYPDYYGLFYISPDGLEPGWYDYILNKDNKGGIYIYNDTNDDIYYESN
jgi:hypothetical protein